MCRLMAYIGPPVLVADVVLWPDRSIIKQSYDARERIMDASLPSHLSHGNLNGDGFGIGAPLGTGIVDVMQSCSACCCIEHRHGLCAAAAMLPC